MSLRSSLREGLDALISCCEKLTEDVGCNHQQDQTSNLLLLHSVASQPVRRDSRLPILLGRETSFIVSKRVEAKDPQIEVASGDDVDTCVRSSSASLDNRSPSLHELDTVDIAASFRQIMSSLDESNDMLVGMQSVMERRGSKSNRAGARHYDHCNTESVTKSLLEDMDQVATEFDVAHDDLESKLFELESHVTARLSRFGIDLHATLEKVAEKSALRLLDERRVNERSKFNKACQSVRFLEGSDESRTFPARRSAKSRKRTPDLSALHEMVRQQNEIAALQSKLAVSRHSLDAHNAAMIHVCDREVAFPESVKDVLTVVFDTIAKKTIDVNEDDALQSEVEALRASIKEINESREILKLSGHSRRNTPSLAMSAAIQAGFPAIPAQTRTERLQTQDLRNKLQQLEGIIGAMEREREAFLCSIARAHEFAASSRSHAIMYSKHRVSLSIPNSSAHAGLSARVSREQSRQRRANLHRTIIQPLNVEAKPLDNVSLAQIALKKQRLLSLEKQYQQLRQQLDKLQQTQSGQKSQPGGASVPHSPSQGLVGMRVDKSDITEVVGSSSVSIQSRNKERRGHVDYNSRMNPQMAHLLWLKQDNMEMIQQMRAIDVLCSKVRAKRLRGEMVDKSCFAELLPGPGEDERMHAESMRAGRKEIRALQRSVREKRLMWSSPETEDPQFTMLATVAAAKMAAVGQGPEKTLLRNLLHPKRNLDRFRHGWEQRLDIGMISADSQDSTPSVPADRNDVLLANKQRVDIASFGGRRLASRPHALHPIKEPQATFEQICAQLSSATTSEFVRPSSKNHFIGLDCKNRRKRLLSYSTTSRRRGEKPCANVCVCLQGIRVKS